MPKGGRSEDMTYDMSPGAHVDTEAADRNLSASEERDELAYRLRQQELIAEFGLFALATPDIESVMQKAVQLAARGMRVTLCKFLEYEPASGDLLLRVGVGWKAGTVGVARLGTDLDSPAGYAFQKREAVLSNHLSNEDRFRTPRLLKEHGVRRALNVPVMYGGDPYGVLEVDTPETGVFTPEDFTFMQSIANTLSVAIERHDERIKVADLREREALLAAEMRHRVKNVLSVVIALISLSRRDAGESPDTLVELLTGRVTALASATEAGLVDERIGGEAPQGIDPLELTRRVLAPYGESVTVTGETLAIKSNEATTLALVLHEMATNAVKYGALSEPDGRVQIDWNAEDGKTQLRWTEKGGPRVGMAPEPSGFGQPMIDRILKSSGGTITRDWDTDGLVALITL